MGLCSCCIWFRDRVVRDQMESHMDHEIEAVSL